MKIIWLAFIISTETIDFFPSQFLARVTQQCPLNIYGKKNDRRVSTFHRNSKCAVMPWAIFKLEIKSQASVCNFISKEALVWVLSCEFCKIFKNSFFTEHLRATASVFGFSTWAYCTSLYMWIESIINDLMPGGNKKVTYA